MSTLRSRKFRRKKACLEAEKIKNTLRMRKVRENKKTFISKSSAERSQEYRKRRTERLQTNECSRAGSITKKDNKKNIIKRTKLKKKVSIIMSESYIMKRTVSVISNIDILNNEYSAADKEFNTKFYNNNFGVSCNVCDRLWFDKNMKNIPMKAVKWILDFYPNMNVSTSRVCDTCYQSLLHFKIPRLATINGFTFPPYPTHLPPLDPISERLISPRIPFMQIRRLRYLNGSKGIIGQVINLPVDINSMVEQLPRQLDDDYAFNVHIKKHLIHKSSALEGYVKKATVKLWLRYLKKKPLYENIQIDDSLLDTYTDEEPMDVVDDENGNNNFDECKNDYENMNEPYIEETSEDPADIKDLFLAKQHTLLWSEDKYLAIAPGMNRRPLSILVDEDAEELSFPGIYLGEKRIFKINNVTPFMKATSEIRRTDRRAGTQIHILYMGATVMRFRVSESLFCTFKANSNLKQLTREHLEDKEFMERLIENNLSFLKSIPNSVQYWLSRRKDLFAMIRQLGKPSLYITLNPNECHWNHLLSLLYGLSTKQEWIHEDKPSISMGSNLRTSLVNDDPTTVCLYFKKIVDTIINILTSKTCTPFGKFRVVDHFVRFEFQQRGSPHAHLLCWIESDPKEIVSEDMPNTINLIDFLISVSPNNTQQENLQTHKHTFTCYKRVKDKENQRCRFDAPFWPMEYTTILIPLTTDDKRRDALKMKFADMHRSLEFEDFKSLSEFFQRHRIHDYSHYLNIIRAGINRPKVFLRRTFAERWINPFNPWISKTMGANCDIQFILDEYSCGTYVVEYVNKTDRGISNLHHELITLRDEYPDRDFSCLLSKVGVKMLNTVEMSSQEAAWYLLNLHMSESSRKILYIPTTWPHERYHVRKTKKRLDEENVAPDSHDIWSQSMIEQYESRPKKLELISLAQFNANYYKCNSSEKYKRRDLPRVIRYRSYDISDFDNYKREMVLLHLPFHSEEKEILHEDNYRSLYENNESIILEQRKQFESNIDIAKVMKECEQMFIHEEDTPGPNQNAQSVEYMTSQEVDNDFINRIQNGLDEDIRLKIMEKMSSVVRKRENVMSSEDYCKLMRQANKRQRFLVLEVIYRLFCYDEALQIFLTGPAGSGKTFLMKLMMETYNRFWQHHDSLYNAYVATASTGSAASAINGATVHSALRVNTTRNINYMSSESINNFRAAFAHVRSIFVDEVSMLGNTILEQIDTRLQQIRCSKKDYGDFDVIFTGDLRQLKPIFQTPIYNHNYGQRSKGEEVWKTLKYYPLEEVVRQSDQTFSNMLTKIGNGEELSPEEKSLIESRFIDADIINKTHPNVLRLFHSREDVKQFNINSICDSTMHLHVAADTYTGYSTEAQRQSAFAKVNSLGVDDTNGMPYMLRLQLDKPYMIRKNINVRDGLVNGAIGTLKYIERSKDTQAIKRLWLYFENPKIGRIAREKYKAHILDNPHLDRAWVPISEFSGYVSLKSKLIKCKRRQFPVVEACAITVHKSQGGTYDAIVYEYDKSHEQKLVYVALSRVTSLDGLFITNKKKDHTFYHYRKINNEELKKEINRLKTCSLYTISDACQDFLNTFSSTELNSLSICTLNVQSLHAHTADVSSDPLISQCDFLFLSETWMKNHTSIAIEGFHMISCSKRDSVRAGGVAIYENDNNNNRTVHHDHQSSIDLTQIETNANSSVNNIGDISIIVSTIRGRVIFMAIVYISTKASFDQTCRFLQQNLYFCKDKSNEIQVIVSGDFNLDLKSAHGTRFTTFMKDQFDLILNTDAQYSTTKNSTCIDAVFSRSIKKINSKVYISYFSTHHPIFTVASQY